jgi:hypothetical protein
LLFGKLYVRHREIRPRLGQLPLELRVDSPDCIGRSLDGSARRIDNLTGGRRATNEAIE